MTLSKGYSRTSRATRRRSDRLHTGTAPRWVCGRGLGVVAGALLWLLCPAYVHAQITFDAASTSTGVSGTTESWSHTVTSSGADRVLVVAVSMRASGTDVSSVTFNGDNLTKVGSVSMTNDTTSQLWILANPDTGTHTIQVTLSASEEMVSGAASFLNVHQTNPVGPYFSASGSGTAPSVAVTGVAADQLVVDALGVRDAPTATVGASQTQRWNGAFASDVRTAGSTESGTGTVTMSWSLSASKSWAIGAVALNPVGSYQTTYGFSDISNPSSTHTAEDGEIDISDADLATGNLGARRDAGITGWANWAEATTAEYNAIDTSADTYYTTADPGIDVNAAHIFEFDITESLSLITQIDVTVEARNKVDSSDLLYVYLWNYATSSYLVGASAPANTTDQVMTFSVTSNPGDYVQASDGQLTVFIANQDTSEYTQVDVVRVVVTSKQATLTGTLADGASED